MSLQTLFTEIADAIRAKDGTTGTIPANTFPARIQAIPSGGGGTDVQGALTELTWTAGAISNNGNLLTFAMSDTSKPVLVIYTLTDGGFGLGIYAYDSSFGWESNGELVGSGNMDVGEEMDASNTDLVLAYSGMSMGGATVEFSNGYCAVLQ